MAHEMVHIRQDQLGMRDQHGAGFNGWRTLCASACGFDRAAF
jgi:hypothetical protein